MNWASRGNKEPDKNKQLHVMSVKEYEELEEELTKYKRAFEILKEIFDIRFEKDEDGDCWIKIFPTTYDDRHVLGEPTNEQYELLEELMNCGTKDN